MLITLFDQDSDPLPFADSSVDILVGECLRAVDRGDVSALLDLGLAFSTSEFGVPPDLIEACKWFQIAGAAGVEEALEFVDDLSAQMRPHELEEAHRRTREWLTTDLLIH